MAGAIHHVFSWVCGQDPGHTWVVGGLALPFCQRCTGLYVGTVVGAAAQAVFRIRAGWRLRWFYGLCLLQMIPFGLHWLEQGPTARTVTGALFAFGLTGFLAALPLAACGAARASTPARVAGLACTLTAGLLALLAAVQCGRPIAAAALAALGTAGLVFLALLLAANAVSVIRRARGARAEAPP